MITEKEFIRRWKKMIPMQKKFCLKYIECFDARQAAIYAGYTGISIVHPIYRILRKVQDVTDYLIAKQNIYSQLVKKEWIINQFTKLYSSSTSEITKINILNQLSKIFQLQSDAAQINIENNMPEVPVQINFTKQDKEIEKDI